MRILHINETGQRGSEISGLLRSMVLSIDHAVSLAEASELIETNSYDVTIIELDTVATGDLKELTRFSSNRMAPQVIACASQDSVDKIARAMDCGASDFVMLPIRPSEFKLRINRAAIQDNNQPVGFAKSPTAEFGPLQMDIASGEVWYGQEHLDLTPRERTVLQVLIRARGASVDKATIASRMFSMDEDANPKAIELYVHRLRKKLAKKNVTIETIRGLGYRLSSEAK